MTIKIKQYGSKLLLSCLHRKPDIMPFLADQHRAPHLTAASQAWFNLLNQLSGISINVRSTATRPLAHISQATKTSKHSTQRLLHVNSYICRYLQSSLHLLKKHEQTLTQLIETGFLYHCADMLATELPEHFVTPNKPAIHQFQTECIRSIESIYAESTFGLLQQSYPFLPNDPVDFLRQQQPDQNMTKSTKSCK